jgi:hypothetical protein
VTLFAGWFVVGFSQVIYNVAQISLRQSITPPAMQSRMNATMRFIVWGTLPIGSLMGGVLATALPVRLALVIAALGSFTSMLWVLFSPLRTLHDVPEERTVGAQGSVGASVLEHRDADPALAGDGDRPLVPGVGVPDDAHAGVGG